MGEQTQEITVEWVQKAGRELNDGGGKLANLLSAASSGCTGR